MGSFRNSNAKENWLKYIVMSQILKQFLMVASELSEMMYFRDQWDKANLKPNYNKNMVVQ